MNLNLLVEEVGLWANRNFRELTPDPDGVASALGMSEEAGELARAVLKRHQLIRGTREEWKQEAAKEVGDVLIKLADICYLLEIDFERAVIDRWLEIEQRDFKSNRQGHGLPIE